MQSEKSRVCGVGPSRCSGASSPPPLRLLLGTGKLFSTSATRLVPWNLTAADDDVWHADGLAWPALAGRSVGTRSWLLLAAALGKTTARPLVASKARPCKSLSASAIRSVLVPPTQCVYRATHHNSNPNSAQTGTRPRRCNFREREGHGTRGYGTWKQAEKGEEHVCALVVVGMCEQSSC